MQHNEMLSLIEKSGLGVILAFEHQLRYVVDLQVNERFQSDVIAFKSRADLDALTIEEAQNIIDASKADMLRAANTKNGILKSDMKSKKKIAVNNVDKGDNDIEKYLKKMRSRGDKLAKGVRYG